MIYICLTGDVICLLISSVKWHNVRCKTEQSSTLVCSINAMRNIISDSESWQSVSIGQCEVKLCSASFHHGSAGSVSCWRLLSRRRYSTHMRLANRLQQLPLDSATPDISRNRCSVRHSVSPSLPLVQFISDKIALLCRARSYVDAVTLLIHFLMIYQCFLFCP